MFLKNPGQGRSPGTRSERGSALLAVIVVMAVVVIISVTVTGVTLSSLGLTSSTRAGIQSIAAAESGINVAEVSLTQGDCLPQFSRTTPAFTARVSYSLSGTNEVWVTGCPGAGVAAQRIKVASTGTAASRGISGSTSGDSTTVEAIYGYVPEVPPGLHASGAAMYLYGGIIFKNNANLLVSESGRAAIQVKQGNMECSNGTVIEGDVVVASGNLNIGGCAIEGNAWASGTATLGNVTGNLTSATVNLSVALLKIKVGGIYTTYVAGSAPAVPDWVDLGYAPGDWIDSAGLPYKVTAIGSDCTLSASMLTTAANGNKPVIINALTGCPGGIKASGDVKLPNDLVVFSEKFDFTNQVTFKSTTTTERKLWFVTPDYNDADNRPTCNPTTQGGFLMKNGFTINATVAAMLYTPCQMEAMNSFEWRGQVYANGTNEFKNNTRFESVSLGLPGIDLDTGTVTSGGSSGTEAELGDLSSMRDLNGGG